MVTRQMVTRFLTPSASDENLARFRFHTGAPITRLSAGESCPPLFRDIGFEAMGRFLRGQLRRLCGPLSPITYLRTADYREPYIDYGRIGRIMLLQPQAVTPWHAGIDAVYVASRGTLIDPNTMVFIPAEIPLALASERFAAVKQRRELVDAIRPQHYQAMIAATIERLEKIERTHQETELVAAPLRKLFQSAKPRERDAAVQCMDQAGLSESDLCTAWHHLPDERREFISAAYQTIAEALS
jgi:hypothetical protein